MNKSLVKILILEDENYQLLKRCPYSRLMISPFNTVSELQAKYQLSRSRSLKCLKL